MAKKKKKDRSTKKSAGRFGGALAEQLGKLELDLDDRQDRDEAPDPGASSASGHRPVAEPEPEPEPEPRLDDDDLFAQAVDEIAPEDVFRGKFGAPGDESVPTPVERAIAEERGESAGAEAGAEAGAKGGETSVDEESARDAVRELREKRLLENSLGGLDVRFEESKYRVKPRPRGYESEPPEEMITPPLPKSGDGLNQIDALAPEQKQLLKRYEKRSRQFRVPEINLRGDTLDDALRRVELFVHQCWKQDERFVRIIHGRGQNSEGDPVLKPAILQWLEGPGFRFVRGYAPEVGRHGDYGSVVVQLERPKS